MTNPFYNPSVKAWSGMTIRQLKIIANRLTLALKESPDDVQLRIDTLAIWTIIQVRYDFRKQQDIRLANKKKQKGNCKAEYKSSDLDMVVEATYHSTSFNPEKTSIVNLTFGE